MIKYYIIFLFLFLPSISNSQGGESAVPFMLIPPNPRVSAMGEAGAGVADDVSAIFLNPGGLAFQKTLNLEFSYSNWLSGLFDYRKKYHPFFFSIAGSNNFSDIGTFSISLIFASLGSYENYYTSQDGILKKDEWNPYEYYFLIGFAREFNENIGIGVNLKYIRSDLRSLDFSDGLAETWAFDIGVLYKLDKFILPVIDLDLSNRFSFGLNLANMGPKVSYVEDKAQADPIPTNLRLGLGIKIIDSKSHELTFASDFSRLLVRRYIETDKEPDEFYKAIFTAWGDGGLKKVISSLGLEYNFRDPDLKVFGNRVAFALRSGYLWEDEEYGNRIYYTFGAGLSYSMINFDFSFLSYINTSLAEDETFKWGMSIIL